MIADLNTVIENLQAALAYCQHENGNRITPAQLLVLKLDLANTLERVSMMLDQSLSNE